MSDFAEQAARNLRDSRGQTLEQMLAGNVEIIGPTHVGNTAHASAV